MCKHFMHKIASPLEFCRIVESGKFLLSSNDIDLKAPINGPDNVICIGVGICQLVIQNQNLSKVVLYYYLLIPDELCGPLHRAEHSCAKGTCSLQQIS